jgi:DUF4097 and DUF4098 domain-containing protein YvlB
MRTETFDTPTPPRLRVSLPSGDVEIRTVDGTQTTVDLSGPGEDEARIEQRRDEIVVEIDKKRLFGFKGDHRISISCPHGAEVDVNMASADLDVRGRIAALDVHSASGDIRVDTIDGDASLHSASGDVEIDTVGGRLTVRSASGDVNVREAVGGANVTTASGDLVLGSVTQGEVKVNSASGDVVVGIRPGSKVRLDASSMSGDCVSEIELSDAPSESDGPEVDFRARTMSGDILVRRAS